MTRPPFALCLLALLVGALYPAVAQAHEVSTLSESTVLGRNFGIAAARVHTASVTGDRLEVVLEAAFFLKNRELFGLEGLGVQGETLFGFLLPLRLRYRTHWQHRSLSFELGAVLGEDYGDAQRLNVADPLVRLIYSSGGDTHVIAGTLFPTHWIHDGLVDDTHKLRGRAEQGLQLRIDGPLLKQDLWVNWRVRETDIRAEEFEIASTTRMSVWDDVVRFDVQGIWVHAGGQVSSDDRLEQNLVMTVGGSVGRRFACTNVCLEDLRVGGRVFASHKSGRGLDTLNGRAVEAAIESRLRFTSGMQLRPRVAYFAGRDFFAERGDRLYGADHYLRFGTNLVLFPLPGLAVEAGVVGQWTGSKLNFTQQLNFVWGRGLGVALTPPHVQPM